MKSVADYCIGMWNGICIGIFFGLITAYYNSSFLASHRFTIFSLWMPLFVLTAGLPNSIVAIVQGVRKYRSVSRQIKPD